MIDEIRWNGDESKPVRSIRTTKRDIYEEQYPQEYWLSSKFVSLKDP